MEGTMASVVEIVKATAWPFTILVIVAGFRKHIALLIGNICKISYNNIAIEFKKEMELLKSRATASLPPAPVSEQNIPDDILLIASHSPKAAIAESWRRLEACSYEAARRSGVSIDDNTSRHPIKLAEMLLANKRIDETSYAIFRKLRILRNEVIHYDKARIAYEDALIYSALSRQICGILAKVV